MSLKSLYIPFSLPVYDYKEKDKSSIDSMISLVLFPIEINNIINEYTYVNCISCNKNISDNYKLCIDCNRYVCKMCSQYIYKFDIIPLDNIRWFDWIKIHPNHTLCCICVRIRYIIMKKK
jgi:hypothetical protein